MRDLRNEEIQFVQTFVNFLRKKAKKIKTLKEKGGINFAAWPLNVKEKLTRKEIYTYNHKDFSQFSEIETLSP